MKTKKIFYTEAVYVWALVLLALGTALTEKADFGLSMVVAPTYLLHLKISQFLPFFTFGMAGYVFQAILLLLLGLIVKKFKVSYLFSFITAVLFGLVLDGLIILTNFIPNNIIWVRIICFICGICFSCTGVSLFFRTYITPEAYELFVQEIASKFGFSVDKVKLCYDGASLLLSIVLSFAFFGLLRFEGIGIGTVVCTFVNGPFIGLLGRNFDKIFEFKDRFKLRKFFK